MSEKSLKNILEGALLAAGRPLSVDTMLTLFLDQEQPTRDDIKAALDELQAEYETRSIELKKVASGYRVQVKIDYSEWVSRLWAEKPSRYSRALLETLALVAYRQPITRGEIEDIRGVSVSSSIMKTLQERDWIKVVGHRDVPGKPAMYATTKIFLDYFNLSTLDELPTLAELRDIDSINAELEFDLPGVPVEEESAEEIVSEDRIDEEDMLSESDTETVESASAAITDEDEGEQKDDSEVSEDDVVESDFVQEEDDDSQESISEEISDDASESQADSSEDTEASNPESDNTESDEEKRA